MTKSYCQSLSPICPNITHELLPETVVCRAAYGDCDVPEFCNGTSSDCPQEDKVGISFLQN